MVASKTDEFILLFFSLNCAIWSRIVKSAAWKWGLWRKCKHTHKFIRSWS